MTIKQLGGVFGRNPTFNDVTIEGELTFDGDIDVNSDLKVDGDLEVTGTIAVGNSSAAAMIDVRTDAGEYALRLENGSGGYFRVADGGLTEIGGNVKLTTAGSGIDFSATSGTGTSELFDDYEEGTFTPGFSASGLSVTYDSQLGTYTKIGNLVVFRIQLGTDAVSGGSSSNSLSISGLPFTPSGFTSSGSIGLAYGMSTSIPDSKWLISTSSTFPLYLGDGTSTTVKSDALGTGVNSNRLYLSGHYYAS